MKISDTTRRLKELMQIMGLSQSELSKKTGLDKSTISYYVNGKREPMQDNIMAISNAFGIDPAWVMGYDVPMKKEVVEYDFSKEYAELLVRVSKDKNFKKFIEQYESLSETNQKTVQILVEGLAKNND